jgi:hypothetical protein
MLIDRVNKTREDHGIAKSPTDHHHDDEENKYDTED